MLASLRTKSFPRVKRGYDPRTVDGYLAELAEWLETGGDDGQRQEMIRHWYEEVGHRISRILTQAEQAAHEIRADAEADAKRTIERAARESSLAVARDRQRSRGVEPPPSRALAEAPASRWRRSDARSSERPSSGPLWTSDSEGAQSDDLEAALLKLAAEAMAQPRTRS